MAIEIANQDYLFAPVTIDNDTEDEGMDEQLLEASEEEVFGGTVPEDVREEEPQDTVEEGSTQRLLHNPLHDLESIWWVASWSVVWYTVKEASGGYDPRKQLATYLQMFPETIGSNTRFWIMKGTAFRLAVKAQTTETRVFPVEFQKILHQLDLLRMKLVTWYEAAYKPFQSPGAQADTRLFDLSHTRVLFYLMAIRELIRRLDASSEVITLQDALNHQNEATPKLS